MPESFFQIRCSLLLRHGHGLLDHAHKGLARGGDSELHKSCPLRALPCQTDRPNLALTKTSVAVNTKPDQFAAWRRLGHECSRIRSSPLANSALTATRRDFTFCRTFRTPSIMPGPEVSCNRDAMSG